jgi:hypothetical protein
MDIDCKSIRVDELCSVLPNDWAEELMEQWDEIKNNTIVLGVFYNSNLIGGAIVTNSVTTDVKTFQDIAQTYFNSGFSYLAFLHILSNYRKLGVMDIWWNKMLHLLPNKNLWLSTSEIKLVKYYQYKNMQISYFDDPSKEWILNTL